MSHITTVTTQVRDAEAARLACERLGLPQPALGTAQLFSGEAAGLLVTLPGWRYPVVFDLAKGEARYDNFEGRWGETAQLERFLQRYAAEKVKIEARRHGHAVAEQQLADGSLKLTIQAGG